ncbi:hypothetical protein WKI71_36710 [Streptomyces sp. MS1.AVA.1]|uniref:Uncharacterized protein n=1 Tax=Streptomyces machairae TaxID=3134109 RepID=A0ABU8USM2_9ACTN
MTPADELRTAAEKIRILATTATDGPWHQSGIGDQGWTVDTPHAFVAETEDSEKGRADADWIAAMHPGVGDKISGLLEAAAGFVDDYPDLTRPHIDDEPCSDHACHIVHASLAVARAINTGSQP